MTETPTATSSLSARLKAETTAVHERMHVLMETLDPFASRNRYARFMLAQSAFQAEVLARSRTAAIHQLVPDLDDRGRQAQAHADLADLRGDMDADALEKLARLEADCGVVERDLRPVALDRSTPLAGLGWVYVNEGSTLGAAFLFKAAQAQLGLSETFGARSLAAAPAGRMTAWRAFTHAIDSAELSRDQQDEVVAGAYAAFECFRVHLVAAFESKSTA